MILLLVISGLVMAITFLLGILVGMGIVEQHRESKTPVEVLQEIVDVLKNKDCPPQHPVFYVDHVKLEGTYEEEGVLSDLQEMARFEYRHPEDGGHIDDQGATVVSGVHEHAGDGDGESGVQNTLERDSSELTLTELHSTDMWDMDAWERDTFKVEEE